MKKERDIHILYCLGYSKEEIFFNKFDKEKLKTTKKLIGKMPISKYFKSKTFWNRDFYTDLNTHDPRQETELFIEVIKNKFPPDTKILFYEMGIGTGCIIISLLDEFPQSIGIGIDISEKAIEIAKKNNKSDRLTIKLSDMNNNIENIDFDGIKILISNPPYLRSFEIKNQYDPFISLYGGEDGLDYYRILKKHVKFFDFCFFEINPPYVDKLKNIFGNFKIHKDLLMLDRIIEINNI